MLVLCVPVRRWIRIMQFDEIDKRQIIAFFLVFEVMINQIRQFDQMVHFCAIQEHGHQQQYGYNPFQYYKVKGQK